MKQKIKDFSQGNLRKWLLKFKVTEKLVPLHIRQQIKWRIKIMDKECLSNGACLLCGCSTPGLQMADIACEKPCYPVMMDKENWELTKKNKYTTIPTKTSRGNLLKVFPYE